MILRSVGTVRDWANLACCPGLKKSEFSHPCASDPKVQRRSAAAKNAQHTFSNVRGVMSSRWGTIESVITGSDAYQLISPSSINVQLYILVRAKEISIILQINDRTISLDVLDRKLSRETAELRLKRQTTLRTGILRPAEEKSASLRPKELSER
jgi:hypothetical protein